MMRWLRTQLGIRCLRLAGVLIVVGCVLKHGIIEGTELAKAVVKRLSDGEQAK